MTLSRLRNHPMLTSLKRPLQIGLAAALVTAIFTLFMPNTYKSEARILPADARGTSNLGQLAAAAAAVGVSVPGQDSADSAYVDILKSRWIQEQVLESTFTYHEKRWYFGPVRERKGTLLNYLKATNRDKGFQKLKGFITINRDLKTKLLTLSVETTSADLSQQVCQRVVALLDQFVVQRSITRGGNKAGFAKKRLQEAREEQSQAENTFQAFIRDNRNYLMSADPDVRIKGLRLESELKLRAQIVATLTISLEQSLLEEKNDMPVLNILDVGNLAEEKSGPARSANVVAAFFLATLLALAWKHRAWIRLASLG